MAIAIYAIANQANSTARRTFSGKRRAHSSWPPMFFAVAQGKSYVSFHRDALYYCRELLENIDGKLFRELTALSEAGYRKYKELQYL